MTIKVSPSQPNYLTVNPNGTVSADFSGTIQAIGVILPTSEGGAALGQSSVIWQEPQLPYQSASIFSQFQGTPGSNELSEFYITSDGQPSAAIYVGASSTDINVSPPTNNGAQLQVSAGTSGSALAAVTQSGKYARTILDGNNNSDFALTGTGAAASVTQSSGVSTTSSIPTPVTSIDITVEKTTANILLLMSGTCWTSEADSKLGVAWNIDYGGWNNAFPGNSGLFYFNDTGVHASFGPTAVIIPNVAQGQHTLEMGISAWYGQITQDSNDINTMIAIELP